MAGSACHVRLPSILTLSALNPHSVIVPSQQYPSSHSGRLRGSVDLSNDRWTNGADGNRLLRPRY